MPPVEDLSLAAHPFRGLWRTVLAIFAPLLIVAALWCGWAMIARHRLRKEIDAIAAKHQPFRPGEFATPKVPDDQNAALLWQAVFAVMPPDDQAATNSNLKYAPYPPFPRAWHQMEDRSIKLNAHAFSLAKRAAAASAVDWGDQASQMLSFPEAALNASRRFANVMGDAVIYYHLNRDDGSAAEYISELLHEGRVISDTGPLVATAVGSSIASLAAERVMTITPDLTIDNTDLSARDSSPGAASRRQIESLIQMLLDESQDVVSRKRSIDFERQFMDQWLEAQRKEIFLLGPMVQLSETRMLEERVIDRLAVEQTSQSAASKIYADHPWVGQSSSSGGSSAREIPRFSRVFLGDDVSELRRYVEVEWRRITDRRMSAIALAIRLYRLDHDGHWPAALSELVPVYLASVPSDPFKNDGTSIGYVIRRHALPDGSDRPMLYFGEVGDPLTAKLPGTPDFGTWQSQQWRDLSRWYPAASGK